MEWKNEQAFAQALDEQDILKSFRERFIIPERNGEPQIYFLGNSLGLQPKGTEPLVQKVFNQWAQYGVEGFFEGDEPWLEYHQQLQKPLAKIVGALPEEVVVMNSLTVNLHLLMATFYQPNGNRNKIICESKAFSSDQYMLETMVRLRGLDPDEIIVEAAPRTGEFIIHEEDILTTIEKHQQDLALVFLGGVNYYTGQVFNMSAITKAGQAAGAKVGFDLAHAAGNVTLSLHDWNVDFAAWCSYKYLNAGPGAVGGAYIHQRYHGDNNLQRLAGWWGYQSENRFKMQKGFVPIASAEGWQVSTPSPILYAAHKASLQLFNEAGMEAILQKQKFLSDYLFFVVNAVNEKVGNGFLQIITPEEGKGCQLSMLVKRSGRAVFDALSKRGVFADWREPDVIRVAPVPLYNTFEEVYLFGQILAEACASFASSF